MTDQEWTAFLDSLTPVHRRVAQTVLARLEYVLERFRSQMLEDSQRTARRSDGNAARINLAFDEIAALARELEQLQGRQSDDGAE